MTDLKSIKKRVEVFLQQEQPAHIILNDDTWLNGYIKNIYEDYFNFLDRKKGEVPVFYIDIVKFEFFKGDTTTLKKWNSKLNQN